MRGKLKKIQSEHPGKEFLIRSIPSMIEYGLMVFHTNENKNYELLQKIDDLLKNADYQDFYGAKIKLLKNNQFQQEISKLAEKDDQIQRLEDMVMTALERPIFYAETYNN